MTHWDVFNGDADGLCALQQLRLADPLDAQIVTGVKRDNALLARVPAAAGDAVTALDISLDPNRPALLALLARGVRVRYIDHHYAGEIPVHPLLDCRIDPAPEVCTSAIADRLLDGRFRAWAVVGAFGDNLSATAHRLALSLGLDGAAVALLKELGESLNYNAYGTTEADLVYAPADLHRMLRGYADPLACIAREPVFARLKQARAADMEDALAVPALMDRRGCTAHRLPDRAWSRRVIGSFANHLAGVDPRRAHAVIVPNGRGSLMVSLRMPAGAESSADEVCRRFGGGGRRIAAGIDHLDASGLDDFLAALEAACTAV
jgi:hypothetical protein